MYHKIIDMPSSETKYVGGNVDVDGYNRTAEAYRNDLEFYYTEGYRMIRLIDYVNGEINTELGKSPLILTFDDGDKTNFNVLGRNEDGSFSICHIVIFSIYIILCNGIQCCGGFVQNQNSTVFIKCSCKK